MADLRNMNFDRSIRQQIAIIQARTPTERFQALCDLLDAARAMAPMDPESIERRRRAMVVKQKEREKLSANSENGSLPGGPTMQRAFESYS